MSDDLNGIFIEIDVADEVAYDPALAAKLEEVCPVDIYANEDGKVALVRENLDECVLCNLCVDAAPKGGVRIIKLYEQ
jgi:NAD-dependent dihydropyrimidine dehydrogenase PreA subunit